VVAAFRRSRSGRPLQRGGSDPTRSSPLYTGLPTCVHTCMSIERQPRQTRAEPQQPALLRRRVVFELSAEQLPLLEAAEVRHGSKRRALVAALEAEVRSVEAESRAADAERQLTEQARATKRKAGKREQGAAKIEAELRQAKEQLQRAEAKLAAARTDAGEAAGLAEDECRRFQEAVAAHEEEIEDLSERAFDQLYCGRCRGWAPPDEWAFGDAEGGGDYAFHESCGDKPPGLIDAGSWLGLRER
jgi:hypothetical protein